MAKEAREGMVMCSMCGQYIPQGKSYGGFGLEPYPSRYHSFCSPEHRSEYLEQEGKKVIACK